MQEEFKHLLRSMNNEILATQRHICKLDKESKSLCQERSVVVNKIETV
jgi:hypothetical protein